MELLMEHDWGEEWRGMMRLRRSTPDAREWDERSKNYPRSREKSPYAAHFIEGLDLSAHETVFDMGCGNGALSIPLAMEGHDVIAADFSEGMLHALEEEAADIGSLHIRTILMSWDEDWAEHGLAEGCADVAIASRSICTDDLEDSIHRLDAVARRRCAITLPVGISPRSDPRILSEIGVPVVRGASAAYAFLMLCRMGRSPEVSYIESEKPNIFKDEADAVQAVGRMVVDALSDTGMSDIREVYLKKAEEWVVEHVVRNPDHGKPDGRGGIQGAVMLDIPRKVSWAYIAWNVA